MSELLTFVESRVSILELVGDSSSRTNKGTTASKLFYGDQLRKGGDRHKGQQSSHVTSFVTAASNKSCPCCSEPHLLELCPRFKSWTVDDRIRWTREKKLCLMCFSAGHWSNQCKFKTRCHLCNRRHHHLVHIQPTEQRGPIRRYARLPRYTSLTPAPLCWVQPRLKIEWLHNEL